MDTALNFREKSLTQQGYDYTPQDLRKLDWGLRFTPTVCMLGAAYGLAVQQPYVHFVLAALGILPFWFPAWHPVDRFYNAVVRPLWRGVSLPPNPLPRRIACLMGGAMNIGIGVGFLYGNLIVAYLFGFILVPLQLIVISTHFCVASWIYEGLLRLLGQWTRPISGQQARELVAGDALLVDVREPDEFARGHLPEAVNIPLDQIESKLDEIRDKSLVLYCQSGLRSQKAVQALKRRGVEGVHNLGAMTRW